MREARKKLLISLMQKNNVLPLDSPMTAARREYSPYPRSIGEDVAQLINDAHISGVTAIYYCCNAQYAMPPRRIGDDMFYYVAQGRGEISIREKTYQVRAGDCAHFARGVLHAACADAREPFEVIALHYTAKVFGALTVPQLLGFPDLFRLGANSPFEEMLSISCREFAVRPVGWQRGLEALVLRMLLFLMRTHGDEMQTEFSLHKRRELERVLPALEYLRENMSTAVNVTKLARVCHLSPPQFRRVFRAALGTTPTEYSRLRRMEEAALLLRGGDETIATIAARVGYAAPAFFAHSFKAIMGVSPGKYRAQNDL
jgi:AraC-like DNA-binding protein/mannose-6-phosphate isomerase-like protein (cupin superfamily)